MQVIISPAKQMRVERDAFAPRGIPPFPEETERLVRELRRIERTEGAEGLRALWRVNDRLLAQNIELLDRFEALRDERDLDDPALAALVSPAVFSYVGIQYQSLAPEVLDLDALDWLQGHLWVVSGLYGCARPFDAIQPYRLEMGARLSVDGTRDLYGFWGDAIARRIEDSDEATLDETTGSPATGASAEKPSDAGACVVNLASVEYAKAVLAHLSMSTQVVTCIFGEELRAGKPVQRATASKIARGSMVRWMAERGCQDASELAAFDVGYRFAPELSSPDTLVFMR
ncbi:YaaA family protein [Enorma phocaeensis]|uniref:YaaA family protein n=1 Tax=Enorma phocaeensis TaxID=1871019 RepID=UPI000C867697|nr:YaaA family protein [Enorma phocaeensis]